MKIAHLLTGLLALAAASSESVAAELVPIEWDAGGRFAKALAVPAGKLAEVCGKLPAGAKVQWQFDAGTAMNFNIHFHDGPKVHYPVKQDGVAQSGGTLEAQVEQDYCWMWTNKSATAATLKLEFVRR
jgi:hypothetical protein